MTADRWRYRALRLGTAVLELLRRRLTPAGQVTLAGLVLSAALGFDTTRNMSYQTFTLLAALSILALAAGLSWRPRLEAAWRLPRHATAGLPLPCVLLVANRGHRLERGLEAGPDAAGARPALEQFLRAAPARPGDAGFLVLLSGFDRWKRLAPEDGAAPAPDAALPEDRKSVV